MFSEEVSTICVEILINKVSQEDEVILMKNKAKNVEYAQVSARFFNLPSYDQLWYIHKYENKDWKAAIKN